MIDPATMTDDELAKERARVAGGIARLQQLSADFPGFDWAKVYDPLGNYHEQLKQELSRRARP